LRIPTPVGGIPMHIDAAPSIVFAVLYGLLFPFIISRFFIPGRRSMLLINVILCTVERVVVYSLRATQALNPGRRTSSGLLIYLQLSFAQGFVQIAQDTIPLLRCLIVNASGGPHHLEPSRYRKQLDPAPEDLPSARKRVRIFTNIFNLVWLASTIPGVAGFTKYGKALHDQMVGDKLQELRYVSTGVALGLMLFTAAWISTVMVRMRSIDKGACRWLLLMLACMVVVCIYRLVVMQYHIPELLYTGAGSQQSAGAKAAFYLLHCLPEWIGSALLVVPNTRQRFQTGPWGDWRNFDGQKGCAEARKEATEKKRQKREEREAKNNAARV
ncbi:hypothetical protein BKA62DRAFT_620637, partial [Auriculariales sp. MPI-PUGE-AT-0066]